MEKNLPGREQGASPNFGLWTVVIFFGHGIGAAAFVVLVNVVSDIPVDRLSKPFISLLYCGLLLGPLSFWARLARPNPKTCSRRFGIAAFLYMQMVMLALGWSAINLGVLKPSEAVQVYAPLMLPFSALIAVIVGLATLHILRGRDSSERHDALPL